MRVVLHLALLRLGRAPLRTLPVFLTITVTVCIALWFAASYDTLIAGAARDAALMTGDADLLAFPRQTESAYLDNTLLERWKCDPAVVSLERFTLADINLAGQKPAETPPPMYGLPRRGPILTGTDAQKPPLPLKTGRWLSGRSGEAVSDAATAARRKWKTGNEIIVRSAAGFFRFRLVGIIAENPAGKHFATISDDTSFRAPPSRAIYVTIEDARSCAGGDRGTAYAALRLSPAVSAQAWKQRNGNARLMLLAQEDILTAMRESASAGNARMQVFSAGGISLLVAFFLVFSILNMEVDEERRSFAMLRMNGFTKKQIFGILLCEGGILALCSWLCGLAAGIILLTIFHFPLQPGFWSIAVSGVFSVVSAVGGALVPACRAAAVPPMEAFAKQEPGLVSGRVWKFFPAGLPLLAVNPMIVFLPGIPEHLRIALYGLPGCPAQAAAFLLLMPGFLLLTERFLCMPAAKLFRLSPLFLRSQLAAGFRRDALLCGALSAGLGFYMMIVIWSASLLLPFLPGTWMPDLFAAVLPRGLDRADIARVRAIPGMREVYPVAVEQAKLAGDPAGSRRLRNVVRQDNVVFMGLDAAAYSGDNPFLPFQWLTDREHALALLKSGGSCCVIPEHFSLVTGLQTGDSFEVIPPEAPGTRLTFTVAGVIAFKGWHWFSKYSGTRRRASRTAAMVFGSYENIACNFRLDRVNFLWMNPAPGAQEENLRHSLALLAAGTPGTSGDGRIGNEYIKLVSRDFLRKSILKRTGQVVNGMLNLPIVILCATALAVASTAFCAVHARRRELRIMRMAGLSAFGAARLVAAEFLLVGITAALVSFLFGIFSGICSAQMASSLSFFGGMGWNFALPWGRVAAGCLIVLGVCLAGTLIPALLPMRRKFFDGREEE